MVNPEDIKGWLEASLENASVLVEGDGQHFDAVIVSPDFRGKTRIQQHQMVYAALGDKMQKTIHALSMQTMTPE
ncbi:MAG: BolA family protein, partial [Pseudomonadota bacterium]|nr:BolA family protein [Pseudomonadota bacterium]